MHEQQFLELLHQEEGKLFYIAWGILGQESDAWDVLQQSVEKAWRNRNKLKAVTVWQIFIDMFIRNEVIRHVYYGTIFIS